MRTRPDPDQTGSNLRMCTCNTLLQLQGLEQAREPGRCSMDVDGLEFPQEGFGLVRKERSSHQKEPRKACEPPCLVGIKSTGKGIRSAQGNQKPQPSIFKMTTMCGPSSSAVSFVFIHRHLFGVSLASVLSSCGVMGQGAENWAE